MNNKKYIYTMLYFLIGEEEEENKKREKSHKHKSFCGILLLFNFFCSLLLCSLKMGKEEEEKNLNFIYCH
jgi:hypothetical protein